MKTLFAINENLATSNFDVLTSEELGKVKGGGSPRDMDLYFDEDME